LKNVRSVRVCFLGLLACGLTQSNSARAEYGMSQEKEMPKTRQADKDKAKTEPAAKLADAGVDPDTYTIGVEDELQISVWREPDLSLPVQVRPDGMITLPLINDLPVVGMTTKGLQNVLTEKLKPFVNEPQVTVIVKNIRSRKVYLVGQVLRPGPYPLNGRKTVLQLIVEAGGLGQFAKGGSVYIMRTVNGQQSRLKFNYKKALSSKPDSGDVELLPGDMVVVP
jgi:polysaccharide export outer membrane protein